MRNTSLSVDPRIIPVVRSLKQKTATIKENKPMNQIIQDISSEKTSQNSAKLQESNNIELKSQNNTKIIKSLKMSKQSNTKRASGKSKTLIRKKSSAKISIDGNTDNRNKTGSMNHSLPPVKVANSKKIETKSKEKNNFNQTAIFQLYMGNKQKHENYNYNKIKTRNKYVQNLMSDLNIKKYKQSCLDLIKNDNLIKKLYEKAGLEKTNYSYETFLQNNFFNQALFMYKLEMLFFDENNFNKKNFKEIFFKNEIVKKLNQINDEIIYKAQMNSLKDVFKNGFNVINNFDLFHE